MLSLRHHTVVRQNGKCQHHLVHLRVAVSAHAENVLFMFIQHFSHAFRVVISGQIISRPVVENIAQQKKPPGIFSVISFQQLFAVIFRTVNIGRNHPSHRISSHRTSPVRFSSIPCPIILTLLSRFWKGFWENIVLQSEKRELRAFLTPAPCSCARYLPNTPPACSPF